MFSKFTIRTRIGMIFAVSFVAIIGLSVTLLLQARERFMDQLKEGSVNQVRMVHQALTGLHQRVQRGELTETEAKRLGRFLINNTIVDERNYLLLYHRLGQLLAHPVRGVDAALDTDEQVRQALRNSETTEAQRMAQFGYRDPTPTMPDIIRRYTGESYTGFSEYLYYPEQEFGYRILTYTDDPLAHPQADLKTVYSEMFAPWGWVIIHGLYEDDIRDQFFDWAARSAGIILVILIALAAVAYFLSSSITAPLRKTEAYMQD